MIARLMGLAVITPEALLREVEARRVTVLDVNAPERFTLAHVPGARHLDPAGFGAAELPPDLDAGLVFYCSNLLCRKAPDAARRARQMGFGDVKVMSAGISGWTGAGLPTEALARG